MTSLAALLAALATPAGCGGESSTARDTAGARPAQPPGPEPAATPVPVGAQSLTRDSAPPLTAAGADAGDSLRFVAHEEHIPAGLPSRTRLLALRNPHEGSAQARSVGAQLFVAYNCVDCHGAEGSGAMGPSFQDGRWHFGGSPGEVFESIYQGRPDGMPSWGGRITDDQIWMLVTYVRSVSAGKDVSTENFTGRTIERTGH